MTTRPALVDFQRAAALVVHYGRHDTAGTAAILAEANAADRHGATRLLFAVLEMYAELVPPMHTDRGLALFADLALDLAAAERSPGC